MSDNTLDTLRRNWPSNAPYLRFSEAATLLGYRSWEEAKPEMHRLEREGYLRNVYSAGLNQVHLFPPREELCGGCGADLARSREPFHIRQQAEGLVSLCCGCAGHGACPLLD